MRSSIEALLGMCIGDQGNFEACLALGVHAACFEEDRHRMVFAAMVEADKRGGKLDLATLATLIPSAVSHLVDLQTSAPVSQNVEAYAREALALYRSREVRRELLGLANALLSRKPFESPDAIERQLADAFGRLLATASQVRGPKRIDQALTELLPEIERQMIERTEGKPSGIPTGFAVLDMVTGGGFGKGSINVAAARTGRGKTTLALNFVHTAAASGAACAYFTVEMPTAELLRKLLSLVGAIKGTRLRIGDMGAHDMDRLMEAQRYLYPKPIWFDDSTGASFEVFAAACRRLKRQGPLDLVVIDYVQQFTVEGNYRSAYERTTAVSHRLKQLALELGIAIIALAQLNREAEKSDGMPDIWHIKDSGAIEQDADLILLIHNHPDTVKLFVGKNRHGKDRFDFPVEADLAFNAFRDLNINLEAHR